MGRIKSTMVKRAARELDERVGGFSKDFNENKKMLRKTMPSKSVRNKVAGMLVRLAKDRD